MANEPRVLAPAGYETPEFQSRDRAGIGGDAGGAQSIHSCAVRVGQAVRGPLQ